MRKHGHRAARSPEYEAWTQMRMRCETRTHAAYARYGGRGITVCERWQVFENFLADMGERPSAGHSIDRIDNDRGYEPDNCRWATRVTQANNRRSSVRITFRGVTKTAAEWARDYSMDNSVLIHRIRLGWSPEKALTQPLRGKATQ